jgi:hypothetical protein
MGRLINATAILTASTGGHAASTPPPSGGPPWQPAHTRHHVSLEASWATDVVFSDPAAAAGAVPGIGAGKLMVTNSVRHTVSIRG